VLVKANAQGSNGDAFTTHYCMVTSIARLAQ
jgi:hypothetical protein